MRTLPHSHQPHIVDSRALCSKKVMIQNYSVLRAKALLTTNLDYYILYYCHLLSHLFSQALSNLFFSQNSEQIFSIVEA